MKVKTPRSRSRRPSRNARKAVFEGPNVAADQLQKEQRRLQASEDAAEGVRSFIEYVRNSRGADVTGGVRNAAERINAALRSVLT